METVVLVLMILVCFNFMLKQTFHKPWSVILISVVCFLFVGLIWPLAIEQSKTQISSWLSNPSLMLDTSVVLTLEVALQMSFCILAANFMTCGPVRKRTLWTYRFLRWFPGILIFPVLFSALVELIFALPGVSFPHIAWSMAAAVLVIVPAGSFLLRWLLPEKELRLELLFLANALIAIFGIVATVNGRTAVAGTNAVEWPALGGIMLLVAAGALVGWLWWRYRQSKRA